MKLRFVLALLVLFSVSMASEANHLHRNHHHHHHRFVRYGHVGGIYFGYGFAPYYVVPFGYSYYPYFRFARRYSTFGAISFSKETGRYGVTWGKYSRRAAINGANAYCSAEDCKPVVWVRGGCAAVAASKETKQLGWGYHTTKYGARRYAMQGCLRSGAKDCKQLAWTCSN